MPPPDLFATAEPPMPAKPLSPLSPRSLPVRTGVYARPRPWTPGHGADPRVSELLVSLAAVRQRDDVDGLLWVLTVALSWLDRPAAERAADVIGGLLREQERGRAA